LHRLDFVSSGSAPLQLKIDTGCDEGVKKLNAMFECTNKLAEDCI